MKRVNEASQKKDFIENWGLGKGSTEEKEFDWS